MLDKINSSNTDIIYTRYFPTSSFYTYYLNNYNKEENVKELLFNIEEILHKLSIPIQNYHFLIQSLYYLLQNCNIVIKYDLNNFLGNNINCTINFNYIIILNNNTVFQFNINTIEKLLYGNELLPYLFNLSIKQEIPNQAIFLTNPKSIDLQLVKNYKINIPQLSNTSLISHSNLRNNLFESLGKMKSNRLSRRSSSVKKNRKSKEKMLLRKRESLHYCTDSDLFIAKKRENNKCKNNKLSNKSDNLERRKSLIKNNNSHGSFKRLNNEIISKYYLFQKEKDQFNYLISQSCAIIENSDNLNIQTEKIKLKKFFNGKYFKNLYQRINIFQNNIKDYCSNEDYEFKSDQGHIYNKKWNFGVKNSKPLYIGQSIKKDTSNNSSIGQNNLSEKNISINNSKSMPNELLKPKVDVPTTQTTPINIESQVNESNRSLKSEFDQSIQILKETTLSVNVKSNEDNCSEKDNKSNSVNIIEKSIVLPSNEVATLENANPVMNNSNTRRNRRTKHSRSSAVCLSSNDIKDILDESKHNETPSSNSANDKNKTIRYELSKEQLERKKLLSRDYYHPSLTTLNSTQFCYNEYYPSVRLPTIQRSSQFLQQQWINNRRLNV